MPGALETPLALQRLAQTGDYDALVALGAVIRGETYHFEIVSNESAAGVSSVLAINEYNKKNPCGLKYVDHLVGKRFLTRV